MLRVANSGSEARATSARLTAASLRPSAFFSSWLLASLSWMLSGCTSSGPAPSAGIASFTADAAAGSSANGQTANQGTSAPNDASGVPAAAAADGSAGPGESGVAVTVPSGGIGSGEQMASSDPLTSSSSPDGGRGDSSGGDGSGGDGSAVPGAASPAATCDLPSSFRWVSSLPLVAPKPPAGRSFASIKDPSIVFYEGKYHVFASVYETTAGAAGWKSVYFEFSDFDQAGAAPQTYMPDLPTGSTVAPQIFYFAPQNRWYLIFQWGARYSTNDDIGNPAGWSAPRPLLAGEPTNALDFWVICDDETCHLFFSRDDGTLYQSKIPIENFPNFSGYQVVMSAPTAGLLFEASNVYKVDGTNKYLLLVEAYGPRYFRSWSSESLDGPWAPLADTQQNPFAGAANVSFTGDQWTNDISHGEMIRSGYDQKLTINACKLQYLYQGTAPGFQGDYSSTPYRLGLLTAQ